MANGDSMINEGQFVNGTAEGYGRFIIIQGNGDWDCQVGYWKNGDLHGYGKDFRYS